jgi:AcrR family transcriptional regulator
MGQKPSNVMKLTTGKQKAPARKRGPRADAQRNRERIVAAAAAAFAQTGADTSVEEIANAAGVAVVTLYRHFPDRDALIRGVGRDAFGKALSEAQAAIAEESTAWDALARILSQSQPLRLSLQFVLASPAAREVMMADAEAQAFKRGLFEVLDDAVQAAQAEGSVRTDVGAGDVAMLFVLLVRQLPLPKLESAPMAMQRCVALMLDAVRVDRGDPLPGSPISRADLGFS